MKCPICGNDMERGFIQTEGRVMLWTKEPHTLTLFTRDDEVEIIHEQNPFCMPSLPAEICKKCKKVVLDY